MSLMWSKEDEHGKKEDESKGGDGVDTMRDIKKINEAKMFACKRAYGCKTW